MTELQTNNRQILCNLLPAHVAVHFIDHQNNTHMVSTDIHMYIGTYTHGNTQTHKYIKVNFFTK